MCLRVHRKGKIMKANWEKIDKNDGVLTIEVEESRVNAAIDQAFKKVSTKINVPGFRKGKVPRKIFENRFGVESLYQDALDILLPQAYSEAVRETGIVPVDRPEVDIEQMEQGKALIFKAKVTVKPEVELGEYKGLQVEAKDFTVTEEEVNKELEAVRNRHAELVVLEEGSEVASGDTAVIDFEGFVGDEAFEGGKGEKYSLEIGSGSFIPGFEEQLIGLKQGDEKDVIVTFPEEYHAEHLAGKEATFKVKIHDIKRKQLPELDDEFAKDVSEFETLEEYKSDLENKLKERKQHDQEHYVQDAVVKQATDNATVEIPQAMIETEIDQMKEDFTMRLQQQGMNLDLYYQFTGSDEAALREQFKADAETRVRTNLVLEAIAEKENVEVTDEEVDAEIAKLAELYSRSVEEIRSIFQARDGLFGLTQDLKIRKTVDMLVDNSKEVATA